MRPVLILVALSLLPAVSLAERDKGVPKSKATPPGVNAGPTTSPPVDLGRVPPGATARYELNDVPPRYVRKEMLAGKPYFVVDEPAAGILARHEQCVKTVTARQQCDRERRRALLELYEAEIAAARTGAGSPAPQIGGASEAAQHFAAVSPAPPAAVSVPPAKLAAPAQPADPTPRQAVVPSAPPPAQEVVADADSPQAIQAAYDTCMRMKPRIECDQERDKRQAQAKRRK